jgi:hypothetical protein
MSGSFTVPASGSFTANTGTTFTGGTTTFAGTGGIAYVSGGGTALVIASDATWTGTFGIYGGVAGANVVNQGTLDHTGGTSYIFGQGFAGYAFANSGAVSSSGGGTLNVGYSGTDSVVNTGTMTANGGNMAVGSVSGSVANNGGTLEANGATSTLTLGSGTTTWTNTGTILATNGGTVDLGGVFSTNNLTSGTINGSAGTLDITGSLNNASATLNVPDGGGIFTLYGGTITGGTVNGTALTFSSSGGTLSCATMSGNFTVPASASFTANTGTTFTGGTTTFAGTGGIAYVSGGGTALALASDATWTGTFGIYGGVAGANVVNHGTLDHTGGTSYIYGQGYAGYTFTNFGTVSSSGGGTLNLSYGGTDLVTNQVGATMTANAGTLSLGNGAATWNNLGTLQATNGGTINLGGPFTTADLGGTINGTGGSLNITGSLNNASATLVAPDGGGIYTLYAGTITGGSVNGSALTFSSFGGTLSGATMSGNFTVPASASFTANTGTTFTGGTTTFTGTGGIAYVSGAGTGLAIASDATWTGTFGIYGGVAGANVVNQGTLDHTGGTSYIYGQGYAGYTFTNFGTVSSSGGGTLNLSYGGTDLVTNQVGATMTANAGTLSLGNGAATWNNLGTLQATNGGTINLGGTFTTADLGGTINGTGGSLNITGSLNNASATLVAPDGGGVYTLYAGTITGGTVNGSALAFSSSGGTLNGTTMNGSFTLPAAAPVIFTAENDTTFTGGTTAFATSTTDTVYLNGTGTALAIAPTETWSGSLNILGQAANLAVVNQGTMDFNGGSNGINGNGNGLSFSNGGTVLVNGGTLTLGLPSGDTITNLAGNTLTGGTWEVFNGGTLSFRATSNAVVTNSATIVLSGIGSTLQTNTGVGPSYQSLEQTLVTNNGTLEVLANRNFAAGNGIVNSGTIQLGGGTLTAPSLANNAGSVLSGYGTFAPTGGTTIGNAVLVSPGSASANNYVNTISFSTPLTLGQGGTYMFDLMNASGTAGTGYDTINIGGNLTITATPASPFTIAVESINPGTGTPGLANFNNFQPYTWKLLSSGTLSGFSASDFVINDSSFTNGLGIGSFFISSAGNNIFLNFTPVPEPSTWAMIAAGLALIAFAAWRRRGVSRRPS